MDKMFGFTYKVYFIKDAIDSPKSKLFIYIRARKEHLFP